MGEKMAKLLVSGLINVEMNVCVHRFPVEYTPIEYAFHQAQADFSGVALNVINALDSLGDAVVPVSILGNDSVARTLISGFKDRNIPCGLLDCRMEQTCTSVVLFDDCGRRKIYCDLKDVQELVFPFESVKNEAASCDALVLCNINFNDELIRNAKSLGKLVLTDVQDLSDIHDAYNRRFLENADIVFLSDEKISDRHEDFLLSLYHEYKNKVIVLGQGKKGALILDSEEGTVCSVESVMTRPVVNTVGAGDALFSCFAHYYVQGKPPLDCLKKAVVFASWKIGESGGAKGFADEKHLDGLCSRIQHAVHRVCAFDPHKS